MRFVLGTLIVVLFAACDAVDERSGCARSSDCPAGQYCAVTADGNVCWVDESPPVVSDVTLTCDTTPCLRDGTLRIEATVGDDHEVAGAEARLDLDPARPIVLSRSGTRWGADVPLRGYAFDAFERPVVATVTGSDGARTTSAAVASGAVQVTRLRWVYDATSAGTAFALTAAGVRTDGTVIVGSSTGRLFFVNADGTDHRPAVAVGTGQITAAPVIGASGIWVGSQDGRLYRITPDGNAVSSGCDSSGAIVAPPALLEGVVERAVAPSQAGMLVVADGAGVCVPTAVNASSSSSPVVLATGDIIVAAGSLLESFTPLANSSLRPRWTGIPPAPIPPSVGSPVELPLAIDGEAAVWSIAAGGQVHRTLSGAETSLVTTVPGSKSGAVFLSDGSAVAGTGDAKLIRTNATGSGWRDSATLVGIPSTPLVLAAPAPTLLVTTSTGRVFTVHQEDGSIAWSATLSATNATLQPANVFTPTGQTPGAELSTAYISSANGKLYAVIVDGQLDTASPWPKAFHDARNTNNAGTQP